MRQLTAERPLAELRETTTTPGGGSADLPPGAGSVPPPRRRRRIGTLLLPPWTRAPLLALGEPAVIFAVLAATIILACASSSGALFLSSAASETLHRTIAADCPNASYPSIRLGPIISIDRAKYEQYDLFEPVDPPTDLPDLAGLDTRARGAMTAEGFSAPYHTAISEGALRAGPPPSGSAAHSARLFFQDGAVDHITPISRGAARGVWLPATYARQLGARPGQRIPLAFSRNNVALPETTVPVAGIYQDLWQEPTTPYWCSYSGLFQNPGSADPPPPALLIVTDQATFAAVQHATAAAATHYWTAPISTGGLTLSAARDVGTRQADAYRRFGQPAPADLGAQNSGSGQMPIFAQQTALVRDGLRGPVVPIALGGTVLALLLVGAAGSFWADRRGREVRLLSSRGVSPAALAFKAVLELLAPAIAGTLIGWQVARWLVRALGPNPHLDRAAPTQALLTAGLALAAGLALLALVAGLRSR
ncbi:MAG: putative transport system permease protein, partial [Mycobacteriales bacterium]